MKRKVIITGPIIGGGLCRLPDGIELLHASDGRAVIDGIGTMSNEQFAQLLPEAWGILSVDRMKLDKHALGVAKNLKIIANHGAGYENIDVDYARSKGITVTHTPNAVTQPTADLAWTLLMSTARLAVGGDAFMRRGEYSGWKNDFFLGRSIHGATLGIFGCGRIGKAVAKRATGFDMRVLYHNRSRIDEAEERQLGATKVDFDQLLAESDFVVVTAPLNPETRHRFNLAAFKKMKPTAVFINVGRGPIVCEADLVTALKEGVIWGAGLDVYENSPTMAPGLADCPRTTFLPHIGSASFEARKAMGDQIVQAVADFFDGRQPQNIIGK